MITYLIANYNNGKYVTDCIGSLFAQKDKRWKAIIYDDCSTDDSLNEIAKILDSKPDNRIKLITAKSNGGYINALCVLMKTSETDNVAILDPDDLIVPKTTGFLLDAFLRSDDVGFVYSKLQRVSNDLSSYLNIYGFDLGRKKALFYRGGGVGAIRAFKKSVFNDVGGLSSLYFGCEDRDLIYKMEEVTRFVFVPEILYLYRVTPVSQTRLLSNRYNIIQNHHNAKLDAIDRRYNGLNKLPALTVVYSFFVLNMILYVKKVIEVFFKRTK